MCWELIRINNNIWELTKIENINHLAEYKNIVSDLIKTIIKHKKHHTKHHTKHQQNTIQTTIPTVII